MLISVVFRAEVRRFLIVSHLAFQQAAKRQNHNKAGAIYLEACTEFVESQMYIGNTLPSTTTNTHQYSEEKFEILPRQKPLPVWEVFGDV